MHVSILLAVVAQAISQRGGIILCIAAKSGASLHQSGWSRMPSAQSSFADLPEMRQQKTENALAADD